MNTPTPSETRSKLPQPEASPPERLSPQSMPSGRAVHVACSPAQTPVAAMDPAIKSIQPGGGVVMSLELAWGRLRRAYLRKFRSGYVARMADRRQGERGDLPIDPVDSRDLKYYRNQGSYWWADADDPFLWRDSLPWMRVGLAEVIVFGSALLVLAVLLALVWWPLILLPLLTFFAILWCFRDPRRGIAEGAGTVVSPADGKLVELEEVDDPVIGPAIRFAVLLSIFNSHANRVSLPGRVVSVRYRQGKFLNSLRPKSSRQPERLDIELAPSDLDGQVIRIGQLTGRFARRIVCWARVGDVFDRGDMYGMIKLGSRTELLIPRLPGLVVEAKIGDKLLAGSTVVARYPSAATSPPAADQSQTDQSHPDQSHPDQTPAVAPS